MRFSTIHEITNYLQECFPDEVIDDDFTRGVIAYMGAEQKRYGEIWDVDELGELVWLSLAFVIG